MLSLCPEKLASAVVRVKGAFVRLLANRSRLFAFFCLQTLHGLGAGWLLLPCVHGRWVKL